MVVAPQFNHVVIMFPIVKPSQIFKQYEQLAKVFLLEEKWPMIRRRALCYNGEGPSCLDPRLCCTAFWNGQSSQALDKEWPIRMGFPPNSVLFTWYPSVHWILSCPTLMGYRPTSMIIYNNHTPHYDITLRLKVEKNKYVFGNRTLLTCLWEVCSCQIQT